MDEEGLKRLNRLRENQSHRPPGKSGWLLDQGWLEYLALTYLNIDPEEFIRMKEAADAESEREADVENTDGRKRRRRKATQQRAGFFWTTRPISLEVRIPCDARELLPAYTPTESELDEGRKETSVPAEPRSIRSTKPRRKKTKYTPDMFPEGTHPDVISAILRLEEEEEREEDKEGGEGEPEVEAGKLRQPLVPGKTLERP